MKKLTPLALSVTLALALPTLAHAEDPSPLALRTGSVDDGLAAGLDMMLLNATILRNGDSVWTRAREGFQMSEVNPELVRRHERNLASKAAYFKRTMDRGRKYLFHIMNEVERRGMPTEIAFLPVVESAFVPGAESHVGAAGLWQFMPATGRQYGLEQTWWYDGRRDVMESTRAALDYLQNLYNMFGDWSLALAAYNWGEGNLSRAIAKVRARGEVESYENIQMPAETRNYVPKLLAVRNLMQEPEKFGLRLDPFPNKPTFVATSNGRHMNIDIAAKLAEISVSEFKELNPAFNLPVYAHKPGRQMLLPASKLHKFETNLAKWDKPLLTWQVHVPDSDTTASELAGRFDMNTTDLLAANNLKSSTLNAGRPVLVAMRGNGSTPALENTDIPAVAAERATLVAFAANPGVSTAPALARSPVTEAARSEPVRNEARTEALASARPATENRAEPPALARAQASPAAEAPRIVAVAHNDAASVARQPAAETRSDPLASARALTAAPAPEAPRAVAPVRSEAARADTVVVPRQPAADPLATARALTASRDSSKPDPLAAARALTANRDSNDNRDSVRTDSVRTVASRADNSGKLGDNVLVSNPDKVVAASVSLHTVASGDTLYNISRRYGMTVADLRSLNGLDDDTVRLGQNLKVINGSPATAPSVTAGLDASPLRQAAFTRPAGGSVDYVVQRGDTVFSIARKFGVAHTDILRWNNQEQLANLQPGQRVRIQHGNL